MTTRPAHLLSFLDKPRASHHAAFQLWRRTHPQGAFLTFASQQRANLHRSACPHIGNTTWPASEGGSLTATEKLCADSPAPLLLWALEHLVEVYDCYHCARLDAKGLVPLTAFSWGYAGWGNAVDELLEAVDKREGSRGFAPPAFVDVRVQRSVRAVGFSGAAFEKRLGAKRHRWMQGLGNQRVATGSTGIQIKDPSAAGDLLTFVQQMAAERRRVLFFCSCGPVKGCHRQAVVDLLLSAANDKGVGLNVEEWPGDLPRVRRVRPADGRRWSYPASLLLGGELPPQGMATLPRGSIVIVERDGREDVMVTGPAEFHNGWRLYPVKEDRLRAPDLKDLARRVKALRDDLGWSAKQSEWA